MLTYRLWYNIPPRIFKLVYSTHLFQISPVSSVVFTVFYLSLVWALWLVAVSFMSLHACGLLSLMDLWIFSFLQLWKIFGHNFFKIFFSYLFLSFEGSNYICSWLLDFVPWFTNSLFILLISLLSLFHFEYFP